MLVLPYKHITQYSSLIKCGKEIRLVIDIVIANVMYNSNVNMGAGSRERTILDFAIKQFFVSKLYSMLNNYNCMRLNVAISIKWFIGPWQYLSQRKQSLCSPV